MPAKQAPPETVQPTRIAPTYQPLRNPLLRALLLLCAVLCLGLGIVGIFVPGMPTTVFVLMAGALAARSSSRLHGWLWRHPLFGSMLQNWAAGGFVSRRAKWSASITMTICAIIMLVVPAPIEARVVSISCMAAVLVWLWKRPEPPPPQISTNSQ